MPYNHKDANCNICRLSKHKVNGISIFYPLKMGVTLIFFSQKKKSKSHVRFLLDKKINL